MKIKEMIEHLKKYPNQDAEILLWRWFPKNKAELNFVSIACTQHNKNIFLILEPEQQWFTEEEYKKMTEE